MSQHAPSLVQVCVVCVLAICVPRPGCSLRCATVRVAYKTIFHQGDAGRAFFVVAVGRVSIQVLDEARGVLKVWLCGEACAASHSQPHWLACVWQTVGSLGVGESFGEQALWSDNKKRTASAMTEGPCQVRSTVMLSCHAAA